MSYNKNQLSWILAVFMLRPVNLQLRVKPLTDKQREFYRMVALQEFVGGRELKKLVGPKAFRLESNWWRSELKFDKKLVGEVVALEGRDNFHYADKINDCYVTLPPDEKLFAIYYAFPHALGMPVTTAAPDESTFGKLTVFTAFDQIVNVFLSLSALNKSGVIESGMTKLILKRSLTNIMSKLPDFGPAQWAESDKMSQWSRIAVSLSYAAARMSLDSASVDVAMNIKTIYYSLESLIQTNLQLFEVLLPDISGFTPGMADESNASILVGAVKDVLAEMPENEWISTDDLFARVAVYGYWMIHGLFEAVTYRNNYVMMHGVAVSESSLQNNLTGQSIRPDMLVDNCGRPFVAAVLMLLASLGVTEVAMAPKMSPKDVSEMSVVKAVRLTPLGRYAAGLSKSVKLPAANLTDQIEVYPDRTMIFMRDMQSPYKPWIESHAESIGFGRYLFTDKSVMRECSSRDYAQKTKDFFTTYICAKPSSVWTGFFDTLIRRSNAVKCVDSSYCMFALDPDDRELHRLVLSDKEMRHHILQAEGFVVLVERDWAVRFREFLASRGYII